MTTKSPLAGGALDGLEAARCARAAPRAPRRRARRRPPARGAADLEALVLAELGRRAHADLDREAQRLALGGQVAEVERRGRRPARCRRRRSRRSTSAPSASRTASSSTASRPRRWITTGGGTLPLRKPGSFRSRPSWRALALDAPLDLLGGHLGLARARAIGQLGDGRLDGAAVHDRHDTVPPVEPWSASCRPR